VLNPIGSHRALGLQAPPPLPREDLERRVSSRPLLGAAGAFGLTLGRLLPSSVQDCPPRRLICREREVMTSVPVIADGWACTFVTLPDGGRQILSFLLPGDVVATGLMFEPQMRCAVEAVTDVRLRSFNRNDVLERMFSDFSLFEAASRACFEAQIRAEDLAVDMGRHAADRRLARLILDLRSRLAERQMMSDSVMAFPLRQHHIADATGLTVVHVSKVLSQFRKQGLIEIEQRRLTILDPVGLARVADVRFG
jgi:CRP-like cAMP-binding protein